MFLNIQVKPAADLSRLEEVLVVTEKQEQSAVSDGGARVRAADILAQRLPSVPDKPAVDAAAAGKPASKTTAAGQSAGSVTKSLTPVEGSAKPNVVQHVASTSVAHLPGDGATAASANAVAADSNARGDASVSGQATAVHTQTGDVPKKTALKAASNAATLNTVSPSAPATNSADSPVTPTAARPKSPVTQPNAQPAGAADNPN
jgi:hypothetical protein